MRQPKLGASVRLLYPRADAAFALGISVRSLDRLLASQSLRFQRLGGRVLIHHKDLEKFAAVNRYEPLSA